MQFYMWLAFVEAPKSAGASGMILVTVLPTSLEDTVNPINLRGMDLSVLFHGRLWSVLGPKPQTLDHQP